MYNIYIYTHTHIQHICIHTYTHTHLVKAGLVFTRHELLPEFLTPHALRPLQPGHSKYSKSLFTYEIIIYIGI